MRNILPFLLIVTAVVFCRSGYAINTDVPVTHKQVTIDGKISPDEINPAAVLTTPTLVGGLEIPPNQTTVYMLVTGQSLYVAFRCLDSNPADLVVKTTKENGAVFVDDSVQLLISGAREASKTNYTHFAVNAAGVKYSNDMTSDKPVSGWQAAASKTPAGWEAEMLIPVQGFHGSMVGPFWRGNAARFRPARAGANEETSAWINPGVTLHNYQRFGFFRLQSNLFPELRQAYGLGTTLPVHAPGERVLSNTTAPMSARTPASTAASGSTSTTTAPR